MQSNSQTIHILDFDVVFKEVINNVEKSYIMLYKKQ